MKFRKQQQPAAVSAGFTAKARLRNIGNGTVELADGTLKFSVEKGRLSKKRQLAKEILIAEIESMERVENEFSVTYKGVTDRFVFEKAEHAEALHTKITEALSLPSKPSETKEEAPKQKLNELAQALSSALKIVDSLFDILRSLHGRVDWNRIESYLKYSRDTLKSINDPNCKINLDFSKLSSAVKERLAEDISKEAYALLKALFEYFSALTPQNDSILQVHPNPEDAKKVVLAYYTLNDIILGAVVEDEEVGKESNELATVLGDLAKSTGLGINVDAVKEAVNKLSAANNMQIAIAESRAVFVQQLQALLTA